MSKIKRLLLILAAGLAAVVVAVIAVGLQFTNFLVDLWWFEALNLRDYFWLKLLYRYIISGGVTLVFFLLFFVNFWFASRFLGLANGGAEVGSPMAQRRYKVLAQKFRTGSLEVYTPLSLLMAIAIAVPFYQAWESSLLFLFGETSGVTDPVYGKDISYYLFRYPLYRTLQGELLFISLMLLAAVAVLYWREHNTFAPHEKYPRGAKLHLSMLVVLAVLIKGWGFALQRDALLYTDRHEPYYFGPGLVELWYHVPLLWAAEISLMLVAAAAMLRIYTRYGGRLVITFVAVFALVLGLRRIHLISDGLERFIVRPNPVKAEGRFMDHNIQATLRAYWLDQVQTIDFRLSEHPQVELGPNTDKILKNIPVWDSEELVEVFEQLQAIRPYYSLRNVDVARLKINGEIEQVNLAAREVNTAKLPVAAQNWENLHLRYTHGYGAVITPAAQVGDQPLRWYLKDLAMYSETGITVAKPEVFFGEEPLPYVVVPNALKPFTGATVFEGGEIPDVDETINQTYDGASGVPLSSPFRRLLLAAYFRDEKLFFSISVTERSKALFRRNIVERIRHITPFLELDGDPYLVVTPNTLQWVVDAYTMSSTYPVSKLSLWEGNSPGGRKGERFNYLRNSIKVVVDAYHGTVDYYIKDETDPIIRAYSRAYPGLFKKLDFMPTALREQLRYPRDALYHQMKVYARYNQSTAAQFYQQPETWDFPHAPSTLPRNSEHEDISIVQPYYLTVNLDQCTSVQEFLLVSPMTPVNRENLSAMGVGGQLRPYACTEGKTDQLVLYRFPRTMQVDGPAQINALIDQHPEISAQFSLWDQRGSELHRGRTLILPFGNSLMYVQPVYLRSSGRTRFPELARVIVVMGSEVVMERSLPEAAAKLAERLRRRGVGGTDTVVPSFPLRP